MTDLILIMSKCMRKTKKVNENQEYFRFHFKGFYLGHKISEILVKPIENSSFEVDQDYLLWVKRNSIKNGILKVDLIKSKKIG